jgi:hypothetical protein
MFNWWVAKPIKPTPPSRRIQRWMIKLFAGSEGTNHPGKSRGARKRRAQIENT